MTKDIVLRLAQNLVDKPEQVQVTATENGDVTNLLLKVAEEDKGKIIGKQGKVIKALRTLATAVAIKANHKVLLDIE